VHLSKLADGSYRLDGNLRPDHGDLLNAVLEEHVDRQLRAQRDGDPSLAQMLPSALRAEALVDLAAQHCRREPGDDSMPDRCRVGVTLTPDDLQHPPVAGCDSELFRLVVSAAGEVLDVGRTTRAWTNGIRRAANQRDHGCVFPGCDRPPSWCDLHHCIEWHPCGTTSIDNAASLCRRHHTFIHNHGWRIVIPTARGKPQVHRPDGARYTIDRVTLN
jgi:5-methylcytosine-specific restriction protein A